MRHFSVLSIAIAAAMVLISAGGFATAATTTTGDMSETSSLVWTISSDTIDGVLEPGEVQSTTVYGEDTRAWDGTSSYARSFDLDTGAVSQGLFNFETRKMFTFDGTDCDEFGRAISDEVIGIDTMGMPVNTSEVVIDPFAVSEYPVWPAFHNTVNAGSSFDILEGTVVTQGETRTVTPSADVPVELNYGVRLWGLDNEPAIGSAGAFMDGHLEQGRGNTTDKAMDLVFSQESTASGLISTFNKVMHYESGLASIVV
ncbi:MAG: hypothetical protein LUQ33_05875 [Methanoregulaceae archaeon]|nr:hypothetical protein [Methanoregulaceae archaeon]